MKPRRLLLLPLVMFVCLSTIVAQTLSSENFAWNNLDNGSKQGIALPENSLADEPLASINDIVPTNSSTQNNSDDNEKLAAVIVRGPYLQKASSSSMVIRWRTDIATNSKVFYGANPNSLTFSQSNTAQTTEHEVEITGLSPATTYYYTVGDAGGQFQTGSADQYFKTAPSPGSSGNYRMWVLGDAGMANFNARSVRDAYYNFNGNTHTDAILMLGDNAYNTGTDAEYQNAVFQNMYEDKLKNSVLWSCPGNHEYYGGASAQTQTGAYYDIFTFPKNGESGGLASGTEAYYSFDYGNVHIISLDSYDSDRSTNGPMGSWLANDLANTTQEWIIAIWHHPPYSKGSHDSDSETELIEMRQNLLPMLEAAGVDLVLGGHSHSYERSHMIQGHYGASSSFDECRMLVDEGDGKEDVDGAYIKDTNDVFQNEGAVYVVTGSAGKISGGPLNHPVMHASINELGSVVLDVAGTTMNVKFLNNSGQVADYFTMKKEYQTVTDNDGDGYSNATECPNGYPCVDTDGDCIPDYEDSDADGDGVPDQTDACRTAIGPSSNYGCPEANTAPVAQDDNYITAANNPLAGNVATNDTDPNPGDQLSVTTIAVVNVSNGVLNLNNSGAFGYTPYTDYVGSDFFVYEICDNGTPQKCDQATVYINVQSGPNTPPTAGDDNYITDMNVSVNSNILSNDTDPDFNGLVLATTPVSGPSNGFVTLYSSGSMIYTPATDFVGADNFIYQVCDDGSPSYCDQATVTITVNSTINTEPDAEEDVNTTTVNVSVGGNVLNNDSDPENDDLNVITTPFIDASNGSVILYANGSYSYSPNTNFIGTDVFTYQVCDNGSPILCDEATVTITVSSGANQAPVAYNDIATTLAGASVYINVLNNDSDPNGDPLTVTNNVIQGPDHGTVTLDGPGIYDYQPEIGYTGSDSFLYEVCDNGSPVLCSQATVYITMTSGGNTKPTAVDDTGYTSVDAPYGGNALDNDSDPNGHTLAMTVTPVTQTTNGSVFLYSNGGYAYYPDAGYVGTDSFVYQVCDNGNPVLCCEATVYLSVSATVNNSPIANNDAFTTNINTAVSGNILSNDTDPDNDNISLSAAPESGTLYGSLVIYNNGDFDYIPNNNFYGTDSFTYEICDDGSPIACDVGTVTITVNPPANDNPVTEDDLYNTSLNVGVSGNLLDNDYDPNGDNLIMNSNPISAPSNGNLTLYTNGQFNYQPNVSFSGLDTFVYEVCDDAPLPACSQATVYINISVAANNPPVAEDDLFSTNVESTFQGNVVNNDTEPDGEGFVVNTIPVQSPNYGSLLLTVNGNISYTPNTAFAGVDSFIYEVCDDNVVPLCGQAVVSIVVSSPTNGGPIANDDNYSTEINTSLSGNLLTNDADPDGDNLIVQTSPIVAPANGSILMYTNGGFSYTPSNGFTGNDSFSYQICDDGSPVICDQATVFINVFEITNNPPVANDDSYILLVNTTYYNEVDLNDSDPDNHNLALTTTPIQAPQHGTVTLYSNGVFAYTPNSNYSGSDSFIYEICDDGNPSLCAQALVELLVNSLNNNLAPVAQDDTKSTSYNVGFFINVLNNDTDPDNNNLFTTEALVIPPAHGNAYMNGNGIYTYTPYSGYVGTDSFEYEMCDDGTPILCDNAVVYITMTSNNIPPSAVDDSYTLVFEGFLVENVLTNDTDPNGNQLTTQTSLVSPPANGIVDIMANGDFTYQPDFSFYGEDSFIYRVCDNGGPSMCSEATVFVTVSEPANDPPVAVDDAFYVEMNSTLTANILSNDTDPDGDNLNYDSVIYSPNNGTVSISPSGDITYTPDNNFLGVDSFTYLVCDDAVITACDQATVTLTVEDNTNYAPIAVDDAKSTSYNVGFTFNLLTNDSDPNGDVLTMTTTTVNGPFKGNATMYASGQVTYTPQSGFVGTDSLTYQVCDNGIPVLCSTAIFRVTMTSNNNPPVANSDNYIVYPGVPLTANVMDNDSDPDNHQLRLITTVVQAPTKGQLTLLNNGNIEYIVNNGSTGTDSFRYRICDNGGPNLCAEATVFINIAPENMAPDAQPDYASTDTDIPVSGNLMSNDSDPDGDNLTISGYPLSGPNSGSVVLSSNGDFTYTPNSGFVGTDSFVYELCDDGIPVICSIASVTIQVGPPANLAPIANDDSFTINEDGTLNGETLVNDSDPEGDAMIVNTSAIVAPLYGSLTLNSDGTFTYSPSANYNGQDSFTYEVCDDAPDVECSVAVVFITIKPINDAPFVVPDTVMVLKNTSITFSILANDYDIDGNIDVSSLWLFNQPPASQGTTTLNPDMTITFVPALDFWGEVDLFVYQVCDDGTPVPPKCDVTAIYITVIPDNVAPVAVADQFTVLEDVEFMGNVLVNDNDPDGDPLSIATIPVASPSGTLILQPNGDFSYTPFPEFSGTDSFSYEVCDGSGACDTAVVTLTIFPVNDPPEAHNDTFVIDEDEMVSGNVLLNDFDIEGDSLILNTTPVTGPSVGSIVINTNGNFTYTPPSDYFGGVAIEYEVCDNGTPSLCDTTSIFITLNPINDAPIAVNDYLSTEENVAVNGNILANDFDVENDIVGVKANPVIPPTNGTVVLAQNGDISYTPDQYFNGTDSFVYEICDMGPPSYCATATVFINVNSVNQPPLANDDGYTTNEDVSFVGNSLNNDLEFDGENLIINTTPISSTQYGAVNLTSDGSFSYFPNLNYYGWDSFTYEVCDDSPLALCDTALVTINVQAINDSPLLVNDSISTLKDNAVQIFELANDSDVDGNLDISTLSIISTPPANEGSIIQNSDGSLIFTPSLGFYGDVTPIQYAICDDGYPLPRACGIAYIYINVAQGNQPPIAVNDNYMIHEDQVATGNVLNNDSDPEGGQLSVSTILFSPPSNGMLTLAPDGSFSYTPDSGFIGVDSFTYEVCDDGVPNYCSLATVFVDVLACPIAEFNVPTICEDESILFVAEDQGGGATYFWDFSQGANPRFSNDRVTFVDFTNPGPREVYLTVTMNGCTRTTQKTVIVHDRPYIDIGPNVSICKGDSAVLGGLPTGPAGATYYWSPSIGLSANNVANPIASPPSNTTYTLFVTLGSCTEVDNVVVTVNELPRAEAGGDNFVCEGNSVQLGGPSGAEPGVTYLWSPAASLDDATAVNPIATPSVTTTYTLTSTLDGCENTDQIEIAVAPAPQADAGPDRITCYEPGGPGIQLGNPNNEQGLIYQWSPSTYLDNQYTSNPICTAPFTINYTMTVIKNGCFREDEVMVTIGDCSGAPIAVFDEIQGVEDQFSFFNVLSNDMSPGGFNLFLDTIIAGPYQGIVDFYDTNGNIRYVPNQDFNGNDELIYRVCDDNIPSLCDTATVILSIAPMNDVPIAMEDYMEVEMNGTLNANVLNNDYDIDLNDNVYLNTTPIINASKGALALSSNGDISYVPITNFEGIDQFTYEICDTGSPTMCQQANVIIVVGACVNLELRVNLQGPYSAAVDSMHTTLNMVRRILPGQNPTNTLLQPTPAGQPYSQAPWNYLGTEGTSFNDSSYVHSIVDWVLVSLRTGTEKSTEVFQHAGLLHSNGRITFVDPCFRTIDPLLSYYVLIEHRNHIGIMTSIPISVTNRSLIHDFRLEDSFKNVTSFGQLQATSGHWMMIAGDAEQLSDMVSFDINGQDKILWNVDNGNFDVYLPADLNMNGDVSGQDKILWDQNNGVSSRVPK